MSATLSVLDSDAVLWRPGELPEGRLHAVAKLTLRLTVYA